MLALRALPLLILVSLPLRAEIVVSAAASLGDVLGELAAGWETSGGEVVRLNLGGSRALALQIAAGAPADVFIGATDAEVDELERRGLLVAGSRRALASNALVVIVPRRSPTRLTDARQLASPSIRRLALADLEGAPAGIHAKRFLERAGVWEKVARKVIPAEDVRGALAMVASGAADAGIVYRTDALASGEVQIAFDPDAPKIRYAAAILRRSRAAGAGAFLEYLRSPAARATFRKHGFLP